MPTPDIAALSSRETHARAVLKPDVSLATANARAAEAIRQRASKDGPVSSLSQMEQRRGLDGGRIDARIDVNIGTTINTTTGKKDRSADPEAQRRFTSAENSAKLAKEFVEKGYEALLPPQKDLARQSLSEAIALWPEGKKILDGITDPARRKQFLDGILNDPEMSVHVGKVLEKTMSADVLADKITEAEAGQKAASEKLTVKKTEEKRIQNELADVRMRLAKFSPPTRGLTTGGASYQDLAKLTSTYDHDTRTLGTYEEEIRNINRRMDTLVASRRGAGAGYSAADIVDLQREAKDLETKAEPLRKNIHLKDQLEKEQEKLKAQKDDLEQKEGAVKLEVADLSREASLAKTEALQARNERTAGEEEFTKNLGNVVREASLDYLQDKMQKADEAQNALIEEEKAKAKTKEERDVLEGVLNRWDKDKRVWTRKGWKTIKVFNKKQINSDFGELMRSGNPEKIIERMLKEGRTDDQVREIMNNKEFVGQMQDKVLERLVTRKIQTGKLSSHEARRIIESDWGKDLVNKAVGNKKGLAEAFEKLRESGAMHGTIGEYLTTRSSSDLLKMLGVILGGTLIGVTGAGGPMIAAAAGGASAAAAGGAMALGS